MDLFSQGFVEILAAEQTPDNPHWYQGTADAVRQAARHFARYDADYYLILAGDHLYRMDYTEMVEAHVDRRADITIAAQPVTIDDAPGDGHLPLRPQRPDRRVRGEAEARSAARDRPEHPAGRDARPATRPTSRSSRRWASTSSRATCCWTCSPADRAKDFGREVIPAALDRYSVSAYLFRGFWADVGTVESFYDANIMLTQPGAPFKFYDPHRPIYTHPRFLPGSRFTDCTHPRGHHRRGVLPRSLLRSSSRSSASGRTSDAAPRFAARCCSAPTTTRIPMRVSRDGRPRLGIGRDVVLDRVIVDKNARIGDGARLVNAQGVQDADGDGYYIRNGIIVVPKDGTIAPGTVV